jgi:hypothetical protein
LGPIGAAIAIEVAKGVINTVMEGVHMGEIHDKNVEGGREEQETN